MSVSQCARRSNQSILKEISPGVSSEAVVRMLVSATVIQGLTGTGRSFSKMAHSYSWQTGIGCWLDASVPCCRDLSIKQFEYPQDT